MLLFELSTAACFVLTLYVAISNASFYSWSKWTRHGWFTSICVTAAGSSLASAALTLDLSPARSVDIVRVLMVFGGLQVIAWSEYADLDLQPFPKRIRQVLIGSIILGSIVFLLPGLGLTGEVRVLERAESSFRYHLPVTTPVGAIIALYFELCLVVTMVRYLRAFRRGVPLAGIHLTGMLLILAAGLHDMSVSMKLSPLPYLFPFAYCLVITLLGFAMSRRWAKDVDDLDQLSNRLERLVQRRTNDLVEAQMALLRREKFAAIGDLASGVAHDINNPVGSALGNIKYLLDAVKRDQTLPDDAPETLQDVKLALERIGRIVSHLLDASRLARRGEQPKPVDLSALVEASVARATTLTSGAVPIRVDVPTGLSALGDPPLLESAVVNLVVNACQAVQTNQSGGLVEVRASSTRDQVTLSIHDNGVGLNCGTRQYVQLPHDPAADVTAVTLSPNPEHSAGELVVESNSQGTTVTLRLKAVTLSPGAAMAS